MNFYFFHLTNNGKTSFKNYNMLLFRKFPISIDSVFFVFHMDCAL